MNKATNLIFAKIYFQKAISDDYVDWAIDCLEDGFDSENLRMLAATEKPFYSLEVEDRFAKSLIELGWSKPSKKESLLSYAKEFAKEIVSGAISPDKGCKEIYLISLELEYPKELKDWLCLDEGHDPITMEWLWNSYDYATGDTKKWFEVILREAKKLAETN